MEIVELPEFSKDVKRLSKKYPSLPSDLNIVLKIIALKPDGRPPFSFTIKGLGLETTLIKVKKIASASFCGRGVQSGFRLIYAYQEIQNKITLIEIYHKSEQSIEDRQRIFHNFQ